MNKKIILVIEDEKGLCDLLADELGNAGYKVVTAGNGAQGLAMIQDIEPDLIICDRSMPGMTGYELLERLRGIYPQYRSLPFIFLTAMTDSRDKLAVTHLKPFAYLEKPLNFDVLLDTIGKALSSKVL